MNSHKEYATGCIPSMHRRSDNNNYHSRRFYMITIAVQERCPLLGTLQCPTAASSNSEASNTSASNTAASNTAASNTAASSNENIDDTQCAHIVLTPLGRAVEAAWQQIPRLYPQLSIVQHTIMPDHIHGIIYVREGTTFHLGQVIKGFKTGCNKALRLLVEEARQAQAASYGPAPAAPAPIPAAPGLSLGLAPAASGLAPAASGLAPAASGLAPAASGLASGLAASGLAPGLSPFQRQLLSWAATMSQLTSKPRGTEQLTSKPRGTEQLTSKPRGTDQPTSKPRGTDQPTSKPQPTGLHLWERGYNDRILFNYSTLEKWKAYLSDNPRRLAIRRLHPDYFRVRFGLTVAGRQYAAIGNRMLLSHLELLQVQLSRHFTDEELERRVEELLQRARHGAVLVSPAISKGEQMVMRRAMDEGLPLVFITPWGFNTFSKPGHKYYEACAAGRFLILAPWEHTNRRIPLTREMCLQLNVMTEEITGLSR